MFESVAIQLAGIGQIIKAQDQLLSFGNDRRFIIGFGIENLNTPDLLSIGKNAEKNSQYVE